MGINHSLWFDSSKRKVLIMSFEKDYTLKISNCLSKMTIQVNESTGFSSDVVYYHKKELKLWYLTSKNRHLWKHQYLATQGIIMILSFKEEVKDDKIQSETMSIFLDQNLEGIPFLVLVDKNNKVDYLIEKIRYQINHSNTITSEIRFQIVDFENDINQISAGFDWLCEVMQPLQV